MPRRWTSIAILMLALPWTGCGGGSSGGSDGSAGSGSSGGGAPTPPIDISAAMTVNLYPRNIIPPHGAQVALDYAASLPGVTGPLPPIHGIQFPFAGQTPPWTVVNATAPPTGWTETTTPTAYVIGTTTAPLMPGASLQTFFSYNTTTLQPATQFRTGPVELLDAAGAVIGTAAMTYR